MNAPMLDMGHAALALRCFGCIVSLPLGDALSTFPRFFLAVCLSVMLLPHAPETWEVTPFALFTEFVIGFVLGAPLRCVADVSEMVGELIDTARGQMVSAVLDPLHGQASSDMAIIAKNASVVVALMCGALEEVVSALARSVEVLPLGTSPGDPTLVSGLVRSGTFLLSEGMRLCGVWVGAFLLVDIACAMVSRVVTGLSFMQAAGMLKMFMLLLLLVVFVVEVERLSEGALRRTLAPWGWDKELPARDASFPGSQVATVAPGGAR